MVVTNFNPINDVLLLIVFVGGVIAYSRSRIPSQTIKNLQDLADSQGKSITELKEGRINDARIIGDLQGQVKVYKELPLRELAEGIKEIGNSNKLILQELQKTSIIASDDRDVVVKGHHE